jgi:hypothetical protein
MDISKQVYELALIAVEENEDCVGFCLACGTEHSDVEPDAQEYECEACGEPAVYGAEQIVIMGGF